MARKGSVTRKTGETDVRVDIVIEGRGKGTISTTIPFFDHMLALLARHGFMDITVTATGDTEVDYHHLVEDVGITFGKALDKALGNKVGISRYGSASVPMDESLAEVSIDISERPYLVWNADFARRKIKDFDPQLLREFFKALADHGGITLHINVLYGKNPHHIIESIFKAFARALHTATSIDERIGDVLSTKGSL